jgi:hypothetical protein
MLFSNAARAALEATLLSPQPLTDGSYLGRTAAQERGPAHTGWEAPADGRASPASSFASPFSSARARAYDAAIAAALDAVTGLSDGLDSPASPSPRRNRLTGAASAFKTVQQPSPAGFPPAAWEGAREGSTRGSPAPSTPGARSSGTPGAWEAPIRTPALSARTRFANPGLQSPHAAHSPPSGLNASDARDSDAALRAAEALYIAHASWRRAGSATAPFMREVDLGGLDGNPYLDSGYAFGRVGWAAGGGHPQEHNVLMAALSRFHGPPSDGPSRRSGGGLRMSGLHGGGEERRYAVLDALASRLGVDASAPGALDVLIERASLLEKGAITAAALDQFAEGVCASVAGHCLGRPLHRPEDGVPRLGLAQTRAVLDVALMELSQLRRERHARDRLCAATAGCTGVQARGSAPIS